MKQSLIKQFLHDYFDLNKVNYSIDDKKVYMVNFTEVLANKLGKGRKFSFNRTISDDYGVEHMSRNNDIFKYIIRDSINKGQIIKAKLDSSIIVKDKLNLDKNILIISQKNIKNTAIAFLFKINSTNNISDTTPESLKFVVVGYDNSTIFPEDIAEEFHNIPFTNASFAFNPKNVNNAHTVAYEYLTKFLNNKYDEHIEANKAYYTERITELEKRHEEFKRERKFKEKEKEQRIDEYHHRVSAARTYQAEENYRKQKESLKNELNKLYEEHKKEIELHYFTTKKRIEEEKSKFDFGVKVYLVSCMVFQYDSSILRLKSAISNEECDLIFNLFLNKVEEYKCPSCRHNADDVLLSINGHFCCKNCSSYYQEEKGCLCKEDNVEKCVFSGNFVPKTKSHQCYSCERFFDTKFLENDILGKNVCNLCIKKTYSGEKINKKDAVYSKRMDSFFKPQDVGKCSYSNDYYPLPNLTKTTGSRKIIAKEHLKKCKITNLTFAPDEMYSDKISKLANNLNEINAEKVKYSKLKEVINKDKIGFNENKYWAIVKIKGLLKSKHILYNKTKKEIIP